jgi:hypothetical protein
VTNLRRNLIGLVSFWHQQPTLLGAVLFFASSIVLLLSVIVFSWAKTQAEKDDDVLGNYTLAMIQSSLPGIEGPAVEERGPLLVAQERCIKGDKIVQVEVTVAFRQVDDQLKAPVPMLTRVPQARAPGCNFALVTYPLPPAVTPGIWRVEGISRAVNTGEVRYWVSENFQVVTAVGPSVVPPR